MIEVTKQGDNLVIKVDSGTITVDKRDAKDLADMINGVHNSNIKTSDKPVR